LATFEYAFSLLTFLEGLGMTVMKIYVSQLREGMVLQD
jgi:hypothetical protein